MRAGHIIAFLIGTNVLVLALYLSGRFSPAPAPSPAESRTVFNRPPATTNPATVRAVTQVVTNEFKWAQLESEDYPTYIERLREIGCPEQTIRDIIIADIEKLMAGRMQEIEGPSEPPKYWKASEKDLVSTIDSLRKLEQKQELDFEKRQVIQELLGIDLAAERLTQKGEKDFYGERLSFLSADKQARIRMLLEKANREEVMLREQSWIENDALTEAEQARLREIQNEKEQAIAATLTPEELDQYNLWFSPSAYKVRNSFAGLDTSEKEFLAIYELQRQFDAAWGNVNPNSLSPGDREKYRAAEEALQQSIRDELGEARYGEYQQAQDADFRQLRMTAAEFGLPMEVARDVFGFKALAQEQRVRIQNDPGLTPLQRDGVLKAIAEETESAVVEALGPRAYRHYLRSGAGRWISE